MSDAPPAVSMIVTCCGRLHHLCQTLPANLAALSTGPLRTELVIVDWQAGASDDLAAWLRRLVWPENIAVRVVHVQPKYGSSWCHPRALNVGAMEACGTSLAFVDADVAVTEAFITQGHALVRAGKIATVHGSLSTWGTKMLSASIFRGWNGYEERWPAVWSPHDTELRKRWATAGIGQVPVDDGLAFVIEHDDTERFYQGPRKTLTRQDMVTIHDVRMKALESLGRWPFANVGREAEWGRVYQTVEVLAS